jgi:hypothetical protein
MSTASSLSPPSPCQQHNTQELYDTININICICITYRIISNRIVSYCTDIHYYRKLMCSCLVTKPNYLSKLVFWHC